MKSIRLYLFISLTLISLSGIAQNLQMTRNGKISFFSKTSLENIDAVNNEVFSAIDPVKGEIAFAVLIKGFHFDRALMEEHFNENYMESTKFPKATFNGKILNLKDILFQKDGRYAAQVEGELSMHGVTKKISTTGEIVVKDGKISSTAKTKFKLKDFNIEVPSVVSEKIAEDIDVTIECNYQPKSN